MANKSLSGEGESKTITFRLPSDVKERIEAAARASDRTLAHFLIHLFKESERDYTDGDARETIRASAADRAKRKDA